MRPPRITVRRQPDGRWAVQVWSASGRQAHTVARVATYPEAVEVFDAEWRWRVRS